MQNRKTGLMISFRAIEHMRRFRMRQILKALFNGLDIMRYFPVKLNSNKSTRLKTHFDAWMGNVREPATTEQVMKLFCKKRQLSLIFKPWLNLTRERLDRKAQFFMTRANAINRTAFDALKLNVKITNKRRTKARKIIHGRAMRLLGIAFHQGFMTNLRVRKLQHKLNRAAGFLFMQLYQKKGMIALKSNVRVQKSSRLVTSQHRYLVATDMLQKWRV